MEETLRKKYPLAVKVANSEFRGDKLIPIGSESKSFMGITSLLFLYDNNNSYLLRFADDAGIPILPENVTIGQLLANRQKQLLELGVRSELQQKKLKDIEEYLTYATKNHIFRDTTIKSLLNHTSHMSQNDVDLRDIGETTNPSIFLTELQYDVEDTKTGFTIQPKKFIEVFKDKNMFIATNPTSYRYNNAAFTLAGEIMGLMTDYPTFFEETKQRVLMKIGATTENPIGLADSIMPYYEVPLTERESFKGFSDFFNTYDYSATESAYSYAKSDCSVAAGGLCATMQALRLYDEELVKFYMGQESSLIPKEERWGADAFVAFSTTMEESSKKQKLHSLGFYRTTETDRPAYISWSRGGNLPPHRAYSSIKIDGEEKIVIVEAHSEDVYCNFISSAGFVLFDATPNTKYGYLHKLYSKNLSAEIERAKQFNEEIFAELPKFKLLPELEKKHITDNIKEILQIVTNHGNGVEVKKLNLARKLDTIKDEQSPILKLFVAEIARISEIEINRRPLSIIRATSK